MVNVGIYGKGDYYITNEYSVSGKYNTDMYKYMANLLVGYTYFLGKDTLSIGAGLGYKIYYYNSKYNQQGIDNVLLQYYEGNIPIEAIYTLPVLDNTSFQLTGQFSYGYFGRMEHVGTKSYHHSYNLYLSAAYQIENFSIGPWLSYDYYTLGTYGGENTVPAGNELQIWAMGLLFNYHF